MNQHPLRIGMICPGYPSGEPGDYRGIFVQQLVQALKARGHRVCVLTSRIRPQDRPVLRIDDAEEIHRFPFWSEGRLLIEYPRVPAVARMLTYLASALWSGRRVFRGFGCDLIHSHFLLPTGLIGAALAGTLRRPHVMTVHGSDVRLANGKALMRSLARWTLRRSGQVTTQARHQTAPLLALGLPESLLATIPMGINEIFLQESNEISNEEPDCNPHSAIPHSAFRIPHFENPHSAFRIPHSLISTRTLREEIYNIPQLLHAMKIVAARDPRVRCTLAGDGPDRARLEALACELGLANCVTFTGWASPERLAAELHRHRVYVSTARVDGASVSLFEAMASGAFPVVADIAANREWIRDGENGRLFPLDDPEALAAALLESLETTELIRQSAQINRLTAETTFSWAGVAMRMEQVYWKTYPETQI